MDETVGILAARLGDRYTVERELGRGGMAVVYLANETKHARKVAIKVLRPELARSLGAERFLREIRIAAQLSHPHLVPLIDSGDADGLLYYVSPFIEGGSLRQRLERDGRLSMGDSVRIAQEVAAGLDYAHRSGVVHRDVKPENILFADGHAVVADFGVAHACSLPGADTITESGIVLGTPEYMSPEQASGEQNLESQSDVYSLACVIYEMLAGEPPFRGGGARLTMARHVTELARPIRALRADIPAAVERALARALAKPPEARFASVMALTAALQEGSAGTSTSFRGATRSIAVLPFVNASADADNEYLSDGITDELINALAKVEGLRVASRTSVFALKGKPQDVRTIGALLGSTVVLEGTVRKSGDRLRITAQLSSTDDGALLWSQRYDRQLDDVFAIQDEIALTICNTLRATSFADLETPSAKHHTTSVAAYGLYLKGRYAWNKRTQEGVAEGIEFFEQAIAEDPMYAAAYTGLADSYALHVDYRSVPVTEGFERAKEYARKALALDDTLAESHASLAWCLFVYDWDWEAAGREFRRAIELDPRYASAHQWYGFLLASRSRLAESLVEGHTAVELDAASVSARRSLGWLYYYARRYDLARDHLGRAIEMNPNAEENYRVLGLTLSMQAEHAEAERVLREALALPGAGSYTKATLGFALARGGMREEAESLHRELVLTSATDYVSPVALATIALGLQQHDLALDYAESAYADRRGWLAYLNVNPIMDPLRGYARFEALTKRMRL